jgi:hypothetical protein
MSQTLMPMVSNPPTRPNGEPFTENDREYWERHDAHLERGMRGIRQHVYQPYPRMLFKALNGRMDRESFERVVVGSEREQRDLQERDPAFKESRREASAFYEGLQQDIARAAAETAAAASKMSEKAQAEYRQRSAASSKHVTS